jgi:hypothetical protein
VQAVDLGERDFELAVDAEELQDEYEVHAQFGTLVDECAEDLHALLFHHFLLH